MPNAYSSVLRSIATDRMGYCEGGYPNGHSPDGCGRFRHHSGRTSGEPREVLRKRVIVSSGECLRLLTDSPWHQLAHLGRDHQVTLRVAFTQREHIPTVSVTISPELVELMDIVPELRGLCGTIRDGLGQVIGGSVPAGIEIDIGTDAELPSWRQIVVFVRARGELADEAAFEMWDRIEDHIRPMLTEYISEHGGALLKSPVEVSNENISIRLIW